MTTLTSSVSQFLTMPKAQALLDELAPADKTLHDWLARLALLSDVPFYNLVPDARMTPKESLRFFYIDPSWQSAMIDGALSIGNSSSMDIRFTEVMADLLKQNSSPLVSQIRIQLEGLQDEAGNDAPLKLLSGMMLRSQIVASWPGLQVLPTYKDGTSAMPLRFEKIGADMLLIIFRGVPTSVCIQQPAHSLGFGPEGGPAGYKVSLRGLGNKTAAGKQVSGTAPVVFTPATLFRNNTAAPNVLNIKAMTQALQQSLVTAGELAAGKTITPSQFALQVVKTSQQATYKPAQLLRSKTAKTKKST